MSVILTTVLTHTLTTGFTVEKVVAATCLTDPAPIAVELSLASVVVPQVTDGTIV